MRQRRVLRKTRLTPERVSDPKVHKRVLRTATCRAPVDQETDKAPAPAELRIRDFGTPNQVRGNKRKFMMLLILIATLAIALLAQAHVKRKYARQSRTLTRSGYTGAEVANRTP